MDEIWKDIEGYEGLYLVSNFGRIKSLVGYNGNIYIEREKILNPYKQLMSKNYFRTIVNLTKDGKGKQFKVHRLIAKAFIPNPNGYKVINHLDSNPLNNRVDNLEWCTQKHNVQHSILSGGTIHTIKTIDRETMLDMLNNHYTYAEISEMLGIAKGTVFNYIKMFNINKKYY